MHHFVLTPQGSAGAQVVVGSLRWVIAVQKEIHEQAAAGEEGQEAERDVDWAVNTREK